MVALQTSLEVFFKIGNSQQCLLKLTGQNYCSSYLKCLEVSSVKAIAFYLKLKLKEQFVKFHPEIMPRACCWKSQLFLEIATFNFFGNVLLNGS